VKAPPNSPLFVIRNQVREYVFQQSGQVPEFPREFDETVESNNQEYSSLQKTFTFIKSNLNRKMYLYYGPNSQHCDYCSSDMEYYLYGFVTATMGSYLYAILLIGIITEDSSKRAYRFYAIFGMLILLVSECYSHYVGSSASLKEMTDSLFFILNEDDYTTKYERILKIRYLCFTIALFLLRVFKYEDEVGKKSRQTIAIIHTLNDILNYFNFTQLQRAAILEDTTLRQHFFDFYRHQEMLKQQIHKEMNFEEKAALISAKFDTEKLFKDTEEEIEQLLNSTNKD
jgi:hypothetical protein